MSLIMYFFPFNILFHLPFSITQPISVLNFVRAMAMCILNLERTLSVLWNELSEKSHYTDRINFDYHPVPPFYPQDENNKTLSN